jgi:hypothetical protein
MTMKGAGLRDVVVPFVVVAFEALVNWLQNLRIS